MGTLATIALGALVITNDPGGYVVDYAHKAETYKAREIRIMGTCASACTIYLGNPRVCVGPKARLKFHAASGGRAGEFANIYMFKRYPPGVRAWLLKRGGLTHKVLTLSGPDLHKLIRSC
jgi:hypothetical protein